MRVPFLVGSTLVFMLLAGCGASAPIAAVVDAAPDAVAPEGDAETIALDPSNTNVEVEVTAITSHTVHFKSTGSLTVSPKNVLASTVDLEIDTTSAQASLGMVEDMAKSDDFLAVGTYPRATFKSQSLAKAAEDKVDLFGELDLHGTKKMLKVPAAVVIDACGVKVQTEFTLDRHDYGVGVGSSMDGSVGDEILVRIDVHAKRPHAPDGCASSEKSG